MTRHPQPAHLHGAPTMTLHEVTELREALEEAYGRLENATRHAFAGEALLAEAKEENERARFAVILANADDPKKLGSNEAAREAKVADLTRESGSLVKMRESEARDYRQTLELARLNVEFVRARLRLAEVAAGVVRSF